MVTAAPAASGALPAGAPLACSRYATTSTYSLSASVPGCSGGIELLMRSYRSLAVRSPQKFRKLSPASGGASKLPCRLGWWHSAHALAYTARPASACAAV